MDNLYREQILEHYRRPHHHGTLPTPDQHVDVDNPLCGDRLSIDLQIRDGVIYSDGTTILVSSHVMDEADRCDELVLIRNGKVVDRGTGAEIRQRAGTDDLEAAFLRYAEQVGGNGDPPVTPRGPDR